MKITIISPKRERFDPNRMEFWEFGFMTKIAGLGTRKYSGTPLALPIISSLIPGDSDVKLVDENVEEIDFNMETDLVILSFFTTAAARGYEIAQIFRERGIKVLIGGCHASMLPKEAINYADSVAIGEAEVLMPQIINDFRGGQLQRFYKMKESERPDLDNHPIPRWDQLKLKAYFNPTLQTMRGSSDCCEFHPVRVHREAKYRYKSIEKVVTEVKFLKKQLAGNPFFMIVDDDITANMIRSKELFKAFIPLNIRWMSQGSIAMANDDEYLELMTKSGGTRIIMGFESISQSKLKKKKKNPANGLTESEKNVKKIQSYGVGIIGTFVFGFDDDDKSCFDHTADFIINNHIALPQLFILTPFPGTRLYKRLEKERRILTKDWNLYTGSTALFCPQQMSPSELEEGYYRTVQKVYSYKSIWSRLTGLWELFDHYAAKTELTILKEKIDILLLNENFRAVAYSYPLFYHTEPEEEQHFQKQLHINLRTFLQQRSKLMAAAAPKSGK